MGINTVADLLTHFPRYHKDTSVITPIQDLTADQKFTVKVQATGYKSTRIRGGRTIQRALLTDETGSIPAVWFNQDYLGRVFANGHEFLFTGNAKLNGKHLNFYPQTYEQVFADREQVHLGILAPQYPLTAGISIKWLRNRIKFLLDHIAELSEELKDPIAELNQTENYVETETALHNIHFPTEEAEVIQAKASLGLAELTNLQLGLLVEKESKQTLSGMPFVFDKQTTDGFISQLPFAPTPDQLLAITEILEDLTKDVPMQRLLQGDVGSGKTIVAVVAAVAAKLAGYQTVVLSPTTVLADQHFVTFQKFLEGQGISIELVTSENQDTKPADILIGTSAVLARKNELIQNLGLVIVDEQHRFGVGQREELLAPLNPPLERYPHFLNMTATPIPRTLALGLFGEIELSSINQKPAGRLPIRTHLVPEKKRSESYDWIKDQLQAGHQVFWVTPLITESEKLDIKSATTVFEQLSTGPFSNFRIGLLHGKLKPQEKEHILSAFKNHKLDILVSTSVIEVGIDIPGATVMVIEGAERFGLAQLHQIRGRVGRNSEQSWCFLFVSEEGTPESSERLEFFSKHNDGLQIAEFDLQNRGPGEVYGTKQSGIPNLKIANLTNLAQVKESKRLAKELYERGVRGIKIFSPSL